MSANYRSGIFGFLASPSLSKRASDNSSGLYGVHDQVPNQETLVYLHAPPCKLHTVNICSILNGVYINVKTPFKILHWSGVYINGKRWA